MDYSEWLEGGYCPPSTLPEVPETYPAEMQVLVASIQADAYWQYAKNEYGVARATRLGQIRYLADTYGLTVNTRVVPAASDTATFRSEGEAAAFKAACTTMPLDAENVFRPALNTWLPQLGRDWSEILKGFDPIKAIKDIFAWRAQFA